MRIEQNRTPQGVLAWEYSSFFSSLEPECSGETLRAEVSHLTTEPQTTTHLRATANIKMQSQSLLLLL